ncbi:hypothetical protein ACFY1U_49310 [Streptomyces sp. NPDC001351]|uniref:hypothetical protein n=1 Tax=Streptomyces sp. NPDC001351 TaxID=3364564 RepID=UPI003693C2CF
MSDSGAGVLDLRFESEQPAGVLAGHAVIVVRPPAGLAPASETALRLRLFRARITSLRRRLPPSSALPPGDRWEDLTTRVRAESSHVLHLPLEAGPPADGASEYHLWWDMDPSERDAGAEGEVRALFDVRLLARRRGADDTVLAAGHITAAWEAPHPVRDLLQLDHLAAHGHLPRPLADAISDLVRANGEMVPWCRYCALSWELEVLTYADRVRGLAEHHDATDVALLLARWDPGTGPDHPDRSRYHPCRCQRLQLGAHPDTAEEWRAETGEAWWEESQDPTARERVEARLREQVDVARLRHLAHRHRTLGGS